MDKEIFLILVGGLIGLVSSLVTTLINFTLERKRQHAEWQHEAEVRINELKREELKEVQDIVATTRRAEIRKKLLQGEPIIVVPEGKLACFLESTLVTLNKGGHKSISKIQVRDEVLSFDFETSSTTVGLVKKIIVQETKEYLIVNDSLCVTPSHGIYTNGRYFQRAGLLTLESNLLDENGNQVRVTSLKLKVQNTKVYNLEIEDRKPFFANHFLVGDISSKEAI